MPKMQEQDRNVLSLKLEELRQLSGQTAEKAEALKKRIIEVEEVIGSATTKIAATARHAIDEDQVLYVRFGKSRGAWQLLVTVADKGDQPPSINDNWTILSNAALWMRAAAVDLLPEIVDKICQAQARHLELAEEALEKLADQASKTRRGKEGA